MITHHQNTRTFGGTQRCQMRFHEMSPEPELRRSDRVAAMSLWLPPPSVLTSSSDRHTQNSMCINTSKGVLDDLFIPCTTWCNKLGHRQLWIIRHNQRCTIKVVWNLPIVPNVCQLSITNSPHKPFLHHITPC